MNLNYVLVVAWRNYSLKLKLLLFYFIVQNAVPDMYKDKVDKLNKILQSAHVDVDALKELACSEGGLVIGKYKLI